MGCNVILANGTPATHAVQKATDTIPIVFVEASDPLGTELIKSLSRPGGNTTGFSNYEWSIGGKWLDLLKQIAPDVTRVLVVFLPGNAGNLGLLRAIEDVAASLRIQVMSAPVLHAAEIEQAITNFARIPNGGLIVLPAVSIWVHRDLIISLVSQHRIPAVYSSRTFPVNGGLLSYVNDPVDAYRQAAKYVDRILRGEKAADLPVQQPTKFELVINLRTAKALGLDVPLYLQQLADEVIE
jgi:putative ABC transport system substrate-binding protein